MLLPTTSFRPRRTSDCTQQYRFVTPRKRPGPRACSGQDRHILRMRSSLLQQLPQILLHRPWLTPDLPIPETLGQNAPREQVPLLGSVALLLIRKTMLPTIQLQIELRFRAVEIEEVRADRMFPAELVPGEPPVAQKSPQAALGVRHRLPQATCASEIPHGRQFATARGGTRATNNVEGRCLQLGDYSPFTPHPGPLPVEGRGRRDERLGDFGSQPPRTEHPGAPVLLPLRPGGGERAGVRWGNPHLLTPRPRARRSSLPQ